jgi:hypothetical protein
MVNFKTLRTASLILLLFPFLLACSSDDLSDLLSRVERLNISRQGYTLGKKLTKEQKETAQKHSVKAADHRTLKFKDGSLYVVTERTSGRVIVLYERYEAATREILKGVVGSLSIEFGDPTVLAHDKIIYWVFGPQGKLSREQYKEARKTDGKLKILATVKLNSSMKILGDNTPSGENNVYYVISSEPVLQLMKSD